MNGEEVAARKERKQKADRYLPEYQQILAQWYGCRPEEVVIADEDLDRKHATDFLLPDGRRVAAKTRRPEVLQDYPNEFALRHDPDGPYRSEWQKVRLGECDLLLYTYCNEEESRLTCWRLIDLAILRLAAQSFFGGCQIPSQFHDDDDDIHLISFDGKSIEGNFGKLLIASGRLA